MNAALAELTRLLNNLIRFGTVSQVDGGRVRVKSGKLETTWIRWISLRAGDVKTWDPPSIGEQVVLLSPEGNTKQAVALLGIYSDANPAPSANLTLDLKTYPDGASIEYDYGTHEFRGTFPEGSKATITATDITANADKVTSNAPETLCTGNLAVQGNLSVGGLSSLNGGMAVQKSGGGSAAQITGTLETTEDVVANGISLTQHKHPENDGGGPTGAPQ